MSDRPARTGDCEVIVIGAGPYGLAVAAHLHAHHIATRVFGEPMSFWRRHMPKGMKLRSPWQATHIADPHAALTLDAYIATHNVPRREPLRLETFIDYGSWFQGCAVPDIDARMVEHVEAVGRRLSRGDHGRRRRRCEACHRRHRARPPAVPPARLRRPAGGAREPYGRSK
jgi:hypothetical protein